MIPNVVADILADPGRALLAALLLCCIIMVVPVIAALRRKAREREQEVEREARRPPPIRRYSAPREQREPHFGPPPVRYAEEEEEDDEDDQEESYRRGGFGGGPPPKTRRSVPAGALTKVVWFGLGIAVGAGGMALTGDMLSISKLLLKPIERGPEETPSPVATRQSAPPKGAARLPGAEADPVRAAEEALAKRSENAPTPAQQQDVGAQIGAFVTGFRTRLPMAVGRDISLVKVDAVDRTVTLAFAIQQTITESQDAGLQKALEERFRGGICHGADELGIRALNETGASFNILYSDLVGRTVARLNVPPSYCKTGD